LGELLSLDEDIGNFFHEQLVKHNIWLTFYIYHKIYKNKILRMSNLNKNIKKIWILLNIFIVCLLLFRMDSKSCEYGIT